MSKRGFGYHYFHNVGLQVLRYFRKDIALHGIHHDAGACAIIIKNKRAAKLSDSATISEAGLVRGACRMQVVSYKDIRTEEAYPPGYFPDSGSLH